MMPEMQREEELDERRNQAKMAHQVLKGQADAYFSKQRPAEEPKQRQQRNDRDRSESYSDGDSDSQDEDDYRSESDDYEGHQKKRDVKGQSKIANFRAKRNEKATERFNVDSGGSDGESSDENADPARRKSRSEGASKFKDKDEQYIDKLVELKHILEIIIKRKEIVKYVENDIFVEKAEGCLVKCVMRSGDYMIAEIEKF